MTQNSNEKGAAFERTVCQRLSLWVSGMKRTDVFWRSAMSGGRASLAARRKRGRKFDAQAGDITATHPAGHAFLSKFCVECKFYKDLGWLQALYEKKGHMDAIWRKPRDEAEMAGKMPFVVAKQNRQPELLLTTTEGVELLGISPGEASFYLPPHDLNAFPFKDIITLPYDEIEASWE